MRDNLNMKIELLSGAENEIKITCNDKMQKMDDEMSDNSCHSFYSDHPSINEEMIVSKKKKTGKNTVKTGFGKAILNKINKMKSV